MRQRKETSYNAEAVFNAATPEEAEQLMQFAFSVSKASLKRALGDDRAVSVLKQVAKKKGGTRTSVSEYPASRKERKKK